MSLDIGIADGSQDWPLVGEPSFALEDDGYYWFLHPLFEALRSATGQYIDLYGNAVFEGEGLNALMGMLAEARTLVESQPVSWRVHVGTQVSPAHRELFREVRRERFLQLLGQWEEIARRARMTGSQVVCFGD